MTTYKEIENGGWHFEAFGGSSGAITKIHTVKHPDYYNQHNLSNNLNSRLASMTDYKGRNLNTWVDNSNLPQYVCDNVSKFKMNGYLR